MSGGSGLASRRPRAIQPRPITRRLTLSRPPRSPEPHAQGKRPVAAGGVGDDLDFELRPGLDGAARTTCAGSRQKLAPLAHGGERRSIRPQWAAPGSVSRRSWRPSSRRVAMVIGGQDLGGDVVVGGEYEAAAPSGWSVDHEYQRSRRPGWGPASGGRAELSCASSDPSAPQGARVVVGSYRVCAASSPGRLS